MSDLPVPAAPPRLLTPADVAILAREVAYEINSLSVVLDKMGITQDEYDRLAEDEIFQKIVAAERLDWNSADSAPRRLRLESAAMLEQFLPKLYARMTDTDEALSSVVESAKFLAKTAGVDGRDDAALTAGEKFSITINLGSDQAVVKDVPVTVTIDNEIPALQHLPEGASSAREV